MHRARRAVLVLAALAAAGCVALSGPCSIERDGERVRVQCDQGGELVLVKPAGELAVDIKAPGKEKGPREGP